VLLKDCDNSSEYSTRSFDTDLSDNQETDEESIYSAESTEGKQSYDDQHIVSNINSNGSNSFKSQSKNSEPKWKQNQNYLNKSIETRYKSGVTRLAETVVGSIKDAFKLTFNQKIYQLVLKNTNDYGTANLKEFKPITGAELDKFFGATILKPNSTACAWVLVRKVDLCPPPKQN
jgi:hypothetical protein